MNKKLRKQIKAYTGVVGAILSFDKLNAQVIYHDIIPDDTVAFPNSKFFSYDFNNDGITDINVWETQFNLGSVSTDPVLGVIYLYSNFIQKDPNLIGCNNRVVAYLHNPLDTIPGNILVNSFAPHVDLEDWFHDWISSSNNCFQAADTFNIDKCVAIKFNILGQWHYAWMRVELLNYSVIIKDYAYQSQPNIPILTCDLTDLSTGNSEYNHQGFIFSQQHNSILISTFQKSNHTSISVYDLLGKEILQQPFEGKEATIKIDRKGIYFVEIKSERGIFRKKVFIY